MAKEPKAATLPIVVKLSASYQV